MIGSGRGDERWVETACGPGEHGYRPVGGGLLECVHCGRLVPRAGLRCDVCQHPAVLLLTKPATRHRARNSSNAFCSRCFDEWSHRASRGMHGRRWF